MQPPRSARSAPCIGSAPSSDARTAGPAPGAVPSASTRLARRDRFAVALAAAVGLFAATAAPRALTDVATSVAAVRSPVFEADGARLRRLIEAWHPATPGLRDAVGADDVALCWADPPSPALWNHYRRLRRLLAPRQLLMPTPETIAALARRAPRGDVLFAWIRHDGAGVPPASPFVDPERLATGARWSVARDAPALRVWRLERAR